MKLTKLILLIAIAPSSFAQDFEGKVIYSNVYSSKVPNIPNQQFNAMMGSTQEYIIKDGNYKSPMNGTFVQWQLYINKDNKLYNKIATTSSILWNDATISTDEVLKAEVNRNVTEVLGRPCDELILTCKSGVQKYYYSTDLKVNPKLFENHKFGNWNEIMARTNALPLRIVMETQQFGLECNAVEIQPMKLDSKLFELPVTTLGTGIGSALIYNGVLIPNAELGHIEINGRDAESRAAYSAKERSQLSWKRWAARLQLYYSRLEALFTPDLFIVGGGVSKSYEEFLPLLSLNTPIVPAVHRNNAGILGAAALAAPATPPTM